MNYQLNSTFVKTVQLLPNGTNVNIYSLNKPKKSFRDQISYITLPDDFVGSDNNIYIKEKYINNRFILFHELAHIRLGHTEKIKGGFLTYISSFYRMAKYELQADYFSLANNIETNKNLEKEIKETIEILTRVNIINMITLIMGSVIMLPIMVIFTKKEKMYRFREFIEICIKGIKINEYRKKET